jgi:acyl carrier protein
MAEENQVTVTRDQVLEAIREIIRTDLKFAGMEINEDLELVGGGLGLDSLDLLMLVTGIEKRFGHKIPQKKLNRDTMGTVGRFADFACAELSAAGR